MIETETDVQLDERTLQQLLGELRRLATEVRANEISDRLGQSEQSFKGGKLRVLFLGQFNHGKSLALNTLLGLPGLLPVGATPTTGIVTEVNYGPDTQITLLDGLGRRKNLSLEQYHALADEAEIGRYRRAEITVPVPVLKEITFVDTPGLSDPDSYDPELLGPEISRADVIVFLLSAVQPLTANEQIFIKEKLTEKSRKRLLFLVNQIDRLNEEDEQLSQVIERINSLLASIQPGANVLTFSAFEAAKGLQQAATSESKGRKAGSKTVKEPDSELLARANYATVKTALTYSLLAEKERLQEATLFGSLEEAADELEKRFEERQTAGQAELRGLEEARAGLEGERVRLERVRDRIQERSLAELNRMAETFIADISAYARRLSNVLPEQIGAAQQATPNDVSRNLPFYLEYALKNYLEARTEQFQDELRTYMQQVGQEIEREFQQTAQTLDPNRAYFLATLPRLRQKDSIYTWIARGVTGLGAITIFLTGNLLGGVLWLVAGEVVRQAGAARNQERDRLVEAGRKALTRALEAAQKNLQEQFGDVQRSLATEVAQVFTQNFNALETRLEELERQAKLSREERAREAIATERALADLKAVRAMLNKIMAKALEG